MCYHPPSIACSHWVCRIFRWNPDTLEEDQLMYAEKFHSKISADAWMANAEIGGNEIAEISEEECTPVTCPAVWDLAEDSFELDIWDIPEPTVVSDQPPL